MDKQLTPQQALRFNRQILMPGFDLDKQERLLNSRVLLVGLGGLGCAAGQYLAATGIGSMTLVDADIVELSNLQRQVLHTDVDVGTAKVLSAQASLQQLNPDLQITALAQRLGGQEASELIPKHDIVLDCSDNLETRNLLNHTCYQHGVPLVSGAAIRMEGQVCSFIPQQQKCPCYQCISQFFGEQNLSCVESGIMSPVVGIIGNMQALEAIKILAGYGEALVGKLLLFDAMQSSWQTFKVPKNPSCEVCTN